MATLEYVAGFVRAIHHGMTFDPPAHITGPVLHRADSGSLFLDAEDGALYREVMSRLTDEHGGKDISPRTLEAYLQDVLFSALDLKSESKDDAVFETRLIEAMRELRRKLGETSVDYLCHVPVLGLDTAGLPTTIGDVHSTCA